MVPTCSTELKPMLTLSDAEKKTLLEIAYQAIQRKLAHNEPLNLDITHHHRQNFQQSCGSFVTLMHNDQLRGCIGLLQGQSILIEDIANNARAAAFNDHRFAPLTQQALDEIQISITLLSDLQPVFFASEADLIAQIRPNIDGLVVQENTYQGTFLPTVWNMLPQPQIFWRQLKQKAGLPSDYWSSTLKVFRYTALSFPTH